MAHDYTDYLRLHRYTCIIMPIKQNTLTISLILLITAIITYYPSLHNDFMIDDFTFLKREYSSLFKTPADFFTKNPEQL